ncbi:unnamed protein product [Mytilus coruscus]|uniref:Uncharacterized protein n=1 Tax=Mytilus coruscus TaxID=42192 RepID=A0A6J8B1E8_MYTCO|nr:unnamed protein product [Mytilus coruscus]
MKKYEPQHAGRIEREWTNNNSESYNHVLKIAVDWKSLVDFVMKMTELVEANFKDLQREMLGRGHFIRFRRHTIILRLPDMNEQRQLSWNDTNIWPDNKNDLLQLLSEELVPSFDSRILVVGAYEAGKTTLVSNLIGKAIPRERQSTDGIDVYFGKLLFDLKTQKLLKKTKGFHSFPKAIYQKIVSYLKSVRVEDVKQQKGALPAKTQHDIPNDDILQKLSKKIDEFEDDSFTDHASDQEVIPIPVLDFAGQIVYHATHQTFITSHGIYLVTFNGSRHLNDSLSDRRDEKRITILGMSRT